MNNWWIASLEYFGLITREEAERISNEIRTSIHKDNYKENYDELTSILDGAKVKELPTLKRLQNEFADLKRDVGVMKLASPDQAIAALRAQLDELDGRITSLVSEKTATPATPEKIVAKPV